MPVRYKEFGRQKYAYRIWNEKSAETGNGFNTRKPDKQVAIVSRVIATDVINTVFAQTEQLLCIIHQIRNATKYVSLKDIKAVMKELKSIYQAPSEEDALYCFEEFSEKWDTKHLRFQNHRRKTGRSYRPISSIPIK